MNQPNFKKSFRNSDIFRWNPECMRWVNKNPAFLTEESHTKVLFMCTNHQHLPQNHYLLSTYCARYYVFFRLFSQLANAKDESQKLVSENEEVPVSNFGSERGLIYEGIYIKHNIITKKNHTKFEFINTKLEQKARERLSYIAFLKNLCLLHLGLQLLIQRGFSLARTIKTGSMGIKNGLFEHYFSNYQR
jgi:hypothetical protein